MFDPELSFEGLFSKSRQMFVGGAMIVLAFLVWKGRDFFSDRAMTQVMETASITVHKGSDAEQLQRAFVSAREACRVEARFTAHDDPRFDIATFDLAVPAATVAQAQTNLKVLLEGMKAAFPGGDANMNIRVDREASAAPPAVSRGLALGFRICAGLLVLWGELLIVLGARRARVPRKYIFATLGIILLMSEMYDFAGSHGSGFSHASTLETDFIRLTLPITAIVALFTLWLTRNPPEEGGRGGTGKDAA